MSETPTVKPDNTIKICLIGASGAGKTCFLGGLQLLSDLRQQSDLRTYTVDQETTQFLNATAQYLQAEQWPPPTAANSHLSLEIHLHNKNFQLNVLDYPGEDFLAALGNLNAHEDIKPLIEQFKSADIILFLIDVLMLQQYSPQVSKTLNALKESIKQSGQQVEAVAIALTKSDALNEEEQALGGQAFVERYLSGLKHVVQDANVNAEFFLVSATGGTTVADGASLPKADPRPVGYEALFDWMFKQHKFKKQRQRFIKPLLVALVLALIGGAFWGEHLYRQRQETAVARAVLADSGLNLQQQLSQLLSLNWQDEQLSRDLAQHVSDWLQNRQSQIAAAESVPQVQRMVAEVKALTEMASPWQSRFESVHEAAQQRLHELRVLQVRRALEQRQVDFPDVFQQFERDYPSSPALATLRAQFEQVQAALAREELEKIRNIPLRTQDGFRSVAEALTRFIEKHPNYPALAALEEVRRVSRLFAQQTEFKVHVAWSVAGTRPVSHRLEVVVGNEPAFILTGGDQTVRRSWDAQRTVRWRVGEPVTVSLWQDNTLFSNELLGEKRETGGLALLLFSDVVDLNPRAEVNGDIKVKFTLTDISPETAAYVKQYLSPQ